MANGTKKAISAVTTGQTVLATDPLTGETKPEKVTATIVTKGDTGFTDLTVHAARGDSKITSTQHHPYWDITRHRWANASDLHIGDHLRGTHGGTVTVATVRNYTTHLPTYNLTVNELHTYYVLAGATPVLVHNCPAAAVQPGSSARINLASAERTEHILVGEQRVDGSWSGGHMWPGNRGKTVFPESWSADDIMEHISDVATDPNARWEGGGPRGSLYTRRGDPARFRVFGERDGVCIRAVVEPAGEGIITGFPDPGAC
ncbi:polymorphic toxin-type HINT domain-containing protein [Streptomyces sp. Ru72]|uniref:polymorphic toxin-type HINT domain-containing protein n=1 Tax=Streptomyces sp. Ru72 TaxID=2080747 RepID=UPI0015E30495|nr:polymorphic toxin-type HINT domain-containing protein [Streptomyces sp. Ru72]